MPNMTPPKLIRDRKKSIFITPSVKAFEDFVNREDIKILQVEIRPMEKSSYTKECFLGVIFYEVLV